MAISRALLVSTVSLWVQQTPQVLRLFAGQLTTLITEESAQYPVMILSSFTPLQHSIHPTELQLLDTN